MGFIAIAVGKLEGLLSFDVIYLIDFFLLLGAFKQSGVIFCSFQFNSLDARSLMDLICFLFSRLYYISSIHYGIPFKAFMFISVAREMHAM